MTTYGLCSYILIIPSAPPLTKNGTGFAAPGSDRMAIKQVTLSSYLGRWALLMVWERERVFRSYKRMSPEERPMRRCRQLFRRERDWMWHSEGISGVSVPIFDF